MVRALNPDYTGVSPGSVPKTPARAGTDEGVSGPDETPRGPEAMAALHRQVPPIDRERCPCHPGGFIARQVNGKPRYVFGFAQAADRVDRNALPAQRVRMHSFPDHFCGQVGFDKRWADRMDASTEREKSQSPRTLMLKVSSHCCSVICSAVPMWRRPALFTSTWTPPNCEVVSARIRSMSLCCETSPARTIGEPP